jgi:hypothetical protein
MSNFLPSIKPSFLSKKNAPQNIQPNSSPKKFINPRTTEVIEKKKTYLPSILTRKTQPIIAKSALKPINNSLKIIKKDQSNIIIKGDFPEKLVHLKKLYYKNVNTNTEISDLEKNIDETLIEILKETSINNSNLFAVIKEVLTVLRQRNTSNNNNANNNARNNARNNAQIKMKQINQICNNNKNILLGTQPRAFFDLFIDFDEIYKKLNNTDMNDIWEALAFYRRLQLSKRKQVLMDRFPQLLKNYYNIIMIFTKYLYILRFLQGKELDSEDDIDFINSFVKTMG